MQLSVIWTLKYRADICLLLHLDLDQFFSHRQSWCRILSRQLRCNQLVESDVHDRGHSIYLTFDVVDRQTRRSNRSQFFGNDRSERDESRFRCGSAQDWTLWEVSSDVLAPFREWRTGFGSPFWCLVENRWSWIVDDDRKCLGQFLCALAQTFILFIPTKFSFIWFSGKQRS